MPATSHGNWSCCVPNIPGCVGVGNTLEERRASVAIMFAMYGKEYRERGALLPAPTSLAETFDMAT